MPSSSKHSTKVDKCVKDTIAACTSAVNKLIKVTENSKSKTKKSGKSKKIGKTKKSGKSRSK